MRTPPRSLGVRAYSVAPHLLHGNVDKFPWWSRLLPTNFEFDKEGSRTMRNRPYPVLKCSRKDGAVFGTVFQDGNQVLGKASYKVSDHSLRVSLGKGTPCASGRANSPRHNEPPRSCPRQATLACRPPRAVATLACRRHIAPPFTRTHLLS